MTECKKRSGLVRSLARILSRFFRPTLGDCKGFSWQAQAANLGLAMQGNLSKGVQSRTQATCSSNGQISSPRVLTAGSSLRLQTEVSFRYLGQGPFTEKLVLWELHPALFNSQTFPLPLPSTSGSLKLPEPLVPGSLSMERTPPLLGSDPQPCKLSSSVGRNGRGKQASSPSYRCITESN